MTDTTFAPFSNGSEYRAWRSRNCDTCAKDYVEGNQDSLCPMEEAISLASITDGKIPRDMAARVGFLEGPYERLRDRCREYQQENA